MKSKRFEVEIEPEVLPSHLDKVGERWEKKKKWNEEENGYITWYGEAKIAVELTNETAPDCYGGSERCVSLVATHKIFGPDENNKPIEKKTVKLLVRPSELIALGDALRGAGLGTGRKTKM